MTTACLIIIGNEILSGRTVDKNLNWLALELNAMGIRLMEVRVVADIEEPIVQAIEQCRGAFDYVFTTGGIGPTHDDITTHAVARAFGVRVVRDAEAERRLLAHFPPEKVNAARMKMADIPEGASLLENPVSIAPGYAMENVYVMAGVPEIMQSMFSALKHKLKGAKPMLSQSVTAHVGEGSIAAALEEVQKRYPQTEIGSYPFQHNGMHGTELVVRGTNEQEIERAIGEIKAFLPQ